MAALAATRPVGNEAALQAPIETVVALVGAVPPPPPQRAELRRELGEKIDRLRKVEFLLRQDREALRRQQVEGTALDRAESLTDRRIAELRDRLQLTSGNFDERRRLEARVAELLEEKRRADEVDIERQERVAALLEEKRAVERRVRELTSTLEGGILRDLRPLPPSEDDDDDESRRRRRNVLLLSTNPNPSMRTTGDEPRHIDELVPEPRMQVVPLPTNAQSLVKVRADIAEVLQQKADIDDEREALSVEIEDAQQSVVAAHQRWSSLNIELPATLDRKGDALAADQAVIERLEVAEAAVIRRIERLRQRAHNTRTHIQELVENAQQDNYKLPSNERRAFAEQTAQSLEQQAFELEQNELRYLREEVRAWRNGTLGVLDTLRDELRVIRNELADAQAFQAAPPANASAQQTADAAATVQNAPGQIAQLEAELERAAAALPNDLPTNRSLLREGTSAVEAALPASLARCRRSVRGVDNFARANKRLRGTIVSKASDAQAKRARRSYIDDRLRHIDDRLAELRRIEQLLLRRIADPAIGGDATDDGEYLA